MGVISFVVEMRQKRVKHIKLDRSRDFKRKGLQVSLVILPEKRELKRGTRLGEMALNDREKERMARDPSILPKIDLLSIRDRPMTSLQRFQALWTFL